jgi:hypothetical protein
MNNSYLKKSEKETEEWFAMLKRRYPEYYAKCKAEVECYRSDPECYVLNAKERIETMLKNNLTKNKYKYEKHKQ